MKAFIRLVVFAIAIIPAAVSQTVGSEQAASDHDSAESEKNEVRKIVQRALPVIRTGGAEWIAENDCLSCHRVGQQVWSLNRAAENGFKTDKRQLDDWNTWATTWQNMVKPERRGEKTMEQTLTSESDTIAQLLLGRPKESTGKDDTKWVLTYREHLLLAQEENGSWKPAGQLPNQKRPKRETEEVTTMWSLLGLKAGGTAKKEYADANHKAREWLGSKTQGESTEWWAVKLLLESADGNEKLADEVQAKLLSLQRDDGGWGWLTQEKSDALGTGIALYALARDGLPSKHPAVQRAVKFLASTQQDDGSWYVHGTKQGYRNDVTETASYWGACWTVIGLLEFERQPPSTSANKRGTTR